MNRKHLILLATAASLALSACSSVIETGSDVSQDPSTTTSETPPETTSEVEETPSTTTEGPQTTSDSPTSDDPGVDYLAWQASGIQYVAWDSENERYIAKMNRSSGEYTSGQPLDVTFQSVDPASGDIAWELAEEDVPQEFVDNARPWAPEVPTHNSRSQIGHLALWGNDNPSEWLDFDGLVLDVVEGHFTEHWVDRGTNPFRFGPPTGPREMSLPCVPRLYGDLALCWVRAGQSSNLDLYLFDEELNRVETVSAPVRSIGVLELGDYVYLGASFTYGVGMGDSAGTEPFYLSFLERDGYTIHVIDVTASLLPNPIDMSNGEFDQNLQIVPLRDGLLWNNGIDENWVAISPLTGVVEEFSLPPNTTFTAVERGGLLPTIEEFTTIWDQWEADDFASPTEGEPEQMMVAVTANPLVIGQVDGEVVWTELGDPSTSPIEGQLGGIYDLENLVVGPNGRWLATDEAVIDAVSGEQWPELDGTQFIEHVDGYDIFSTVGQGFDRPLDDMGEVYAINNAN